MSSRMCALSSRISSVMSRKSATVMRLAQSGIPTVNFDGPPPPAYRGIRNERRQRVGSIKGIRSGTCPSVGRRLPVSHLRRGPVATQRHRRMTTVDRLCRMGTIPATATPGPNLDIQLAARVEGYLCRHTLIALIARIIDSTGSSTSDGIAPTSCAPMNVPTMDPTAITIRKVRLRRTTAKVWSRL